MTRSCGDGQISSGMTAPGVAYRYRRSSEALFRVFDNTAYPIRRLPACTSASSVTDDAELGRRDGPLTRASELGASHLAEVHETGDRRRLLRKRCIQMDSERRFLCFTSRYLSCPIKPLNPCCDLPLWRRT